MWFVMGVWSLAAWLMALDVEIAAYLSGAALVPFRALVPALAEWYLWVPLTPVVLRLGARYPRAYALHAAAILVASALRGTVYATTTVFVARAALLQPWPAYLARVTIGFLPIAGALYVAILFFGRARTGEAQLARAELAALRAHLHPHFLFNALHSVGALVRARDHDGAILVIAELSDLLRALLARGAPEEVPLREEIAFLRRYLGIEQVRFSDRLRVEWRIAAEAEDAAVPRLLLQPLAENAVRHGIARSSVAGRITISAFRDGDRVVIAVTDDGPGPNGAAPGLGLSATRARLLHACGKAATLSLGRAPEGGAVAAIQLPYRPVRAT